MLHWPEDDEVEAPLMGDTPYFFSARVGNVDKAWKLWNRFAPNPMPRRRFREVARFIG